MSRFDRSLRSRFYLTAPRPCPYLPGQRERKLFTHLAGAQASALHDDLTAHGFRRSQNIAYRPACEACEACVSTRVRADAFTPSRGQRRALARNVRLARTERRPVATDEHYHLFRRYLLSRHASGGMTDMDAADFASMVEDTPVNTILVEYREPAARPEDEGELVAACVADILADGLSLIYSYFDTQDPRRSLGSYVIMDHIKQAQTRRLPYVYLGYWVRGSEKMAYKTSYRPSELLRDAGWRAVEPEAEP